MKEVNRDFRYINMDYLEEMSDGKMELITEMIEIFRKQVPEFIETMNKCIKEENWQALGKITHKAKASAAIMGMTKLATDLKTFEKMTNNPINKDNFDKLVLDFENRFHHAIKELNIYLSNIK